MQYTGNKQSSSIPSLSLLNLCMCSDRDGSCRSMFTQHSAKWCPDPDPAQIIITRQPLKKMLSDQWKNWSGLDRRLHFSYVGINLPTARFCSETKLFIFKKKLSTFCQPPQMLGGKHHHNFHLTSSCFRNAQCLLRPPYATGRTGFSKSWNRTVTC